MIRHIPSSKSPDNVEDLAATSSGVSEETVRIELVRADKDFGVVKYKPLFFTSRISQNNQINQERDIPNVADYRRTTGNENTFINIIFDDPVGKTCVPLSPYVDISNRICTPSGVTVLYLNTSKITACIYGSRSLSSNEGRRSISVTLSNSA